MLLRKLTAECIGTFALVFAGTGAIIVNDLYGGALGHLGVSISFGAIVLVMIYSIGDVSGAHINPAVTIGFWLAKRFPSGEVIAYIIAQLVGACLASLLLFWMYPNHATLGATLPSKGWQEAFLFEYLLTFLLMYVILNVSHKGKEEGILAGIAIGTTVCLEALIGGPVSGASMNPARSIAPAVFSGNFQYLWIYLVATILGAISAVYICKLVKPNNCCNNNC